MSRTCRQCCQPILLGLVASFLFPCGSLAATADSKPAVDVEQLASSAKIYRDRWGIPHIDGETDESVVFAFAYAQAEDYFWQVEDTFILVLGRYAEVHGPKAINSDLLNRAYEIVPRAKRDFAKMPEEIKSLCVAFTEGLNYYLRTHPEVRPRLIKRFEPWHLVAYSRHLMLEICFRYTRLHSDYTPLTNPRIAASTGSNAWAISGKRTKSGNAMLMVNPHQPWFGFGQLYEAHLRSAEGWNFTGACFFGSPLPILGHNEHLGWTMTTNEPDVADVWRETFDHPTDRLKYRYGDGYRTATEWSTTIDVLNGHGVEPRKFTLKKTHHGPIVAKESEKHQLSARVGRLHEAMMLRQLLPMLRAKNFQEFYAAAGRMEFTIMNMIYADREGNIFYLYNGQVARRDPRFDWSKPVDGSDPATEWRGYHTIDEMPQVFNPASGYVQNCNSTPFTTTTKGQGNPDINDFPPYMVEDKHDDKRRAKRAREILDPLEDVTFEEFRDLCFDTKLYWATHELPKYAAALDKLEKDDPRLAARVRPYFDHMAKGWNYRITEDSSQATLCEAWYEELYGTAYPGETMRAKYVGKVDKQLEALVRVAGRLKTVHGRWQVPYGDVFRIQRVSNTADLLNLRFSDKRPSLPCVSGHGPMGIVNVQYYTPSIHIPFVYSQKRRYGVVGTTYLAAYEFGPKIRGESLTQFGASGDESSPHYMDQAKLLSNSKMKKALFYWDDVFAQAVTVYQPGEKPRPMRELATRPTDGPKKQ
ncbi:MAG: penicillin acylase family protein [Pirellulales bacterium]|nr:penicillin acylase family protein [Pirellulales bacterium]